jgi:hypothetical protein
MLNRRKAGLIVLGFTVASVFVLASQASAADYKNACRNSALGANWDQVDVSLNGTASPAAPGGTVTLSNINQTLAVPPGIFVAGYNLGLLSEGANSIPATLHSVIDAANTAQGSETTNNVDVTISTTITDPDHNPSTGDETATPGTATAHFADETWTAGASGTISFHERNDTGITGATGGGIIAVAHLGGGAINVQFHCTSGTVAGSSPGVPTFSDAPSFASSQITNPACTKLRKKLKKAKKAHNKAKVKKIKSQLRKNGC